MLCFNWFLTYFLDFLANHILGKKYAHYIFIIVPSQSLNFWTNDIFSKVNILCFNWFLTYFSDFLAWLCEHVLVDISPEVLLIIYARIWSPVIHIQYRPPRT